MKLAMCITCKGRTQHLRQTLPRNLADNDHPDVKFVLLNYNSDDGLLEWVCRELGWAIACGRLAVYTNPHPDRFHMAHAKNMAHRLGIMEGADILVNLDADNFTGRGFGALVIAEFERYPNIFLWADAKKAMRRGISGRIVVSSHAFLNVGGYDERFDTWSHDDRDFNQRLQRLGYTPREIPPEYLDSIRHGDGIRFREYPHVRHNRGCYEDPPYPEADCTIANWGEFGCGMVFEGCLEGPPLYLRPVPTRIFGIGLHKTGTTSLDHALKTLGFDSAHWTSPRWAKAIWDEMKAEGRSLTLEYSYALSDLPIPLLFRELDAAYPGSKFILTLRDEASWIDSVRRHWSYEHNQYRRDWDVNCFTHRVHRELYGQKHFEHDVMLQRYRRHTDEVMAHFRDRPDDLLVMDLASVDWPALCQFLWAPTPDGGYPRIRP